MSNFSPMKCGSCGCVWVAMEAFGNEPNIKELRLTCSNCSNRTIVRLSNPSMKLSPDVKNPDGGYHCIWDYEGDR